MLQLRCEHACLEEKDTCSFLLKCIRFLSEAVVKKEDALPREDVLEFAKLISITLKVYLDIIKPVTSIGGNDLSIPFTFCGYDVIFNDRTFFLGE